MWALDPAGAAPSVVMWSDASRPAPRGAAVRSLSLRGGPGFGCPLFRRWGTIDQQTRPHLRGLCCCTMYE